MKKLRPILKQSELQIKVERDASEAQLGLTERSPE